MPLTLTWLAYYYENQERLDDEMARDCREAELLKPELSNPVFLNKLQTLKKPK